MSTETCAVACRLTSKELAVRKQSVIEQLKVKITAATELENGYVFTFNSAADETLDEVVHFIKLEKECCPFFDFHLQINSQQLTLSLTGPEGAKTFIREEMDLLS